MNVSWVSRTRALLLSWRGEEPGWGYRPLSQPGVEPTVLAALALRASTGIEPDAAGTDAVSAAAQWLETLQQSDGALGLSAAMAAPHWGTAAGLLLWSECGGHADAARHAVEWLFAHQGNRGPSTPGVSFAHDAAIPGWPWVDGTHSWLEPTAWAVLALDRAGHRDHARTCEGRRLIRDRAIRTGGWNYGNTQVFGTDLRAQPGPTGLALLALAGIDDADAPHIERACAYLTHTLPSTRAPQSLCWGLLGLAAWGRRPDDSDAWLESATDKAVRRSDRAVQLAYLLLARAPEAVRCLCGPDLSKA